MNRSPRYHCNAFEEMGTYNFIYRCPTFRLVAWNDSYLISSWNDSHPWSILSLSRSRDQAPKWRMTTKVRSRYGGGTLRPRTTFRSSRWRQHWRRAHKKSASTWPISRQKRRREIPPLPTKYVLQWNLPLEWRHNERDDVSNRQRLDCLLAPFSGADQIRFQSSASLAVVREFPAQRASDAENVSIWWRHRVLGQWSLGDWNEILVK